MFSNGSSGAKTLNTRTARYIPIDDPLVLKLQLTSAFDKEPGEL